jgi:sulfatase modifying factor 1
VVGEGRYVGTMIRPPIFLNEAALGLGCFRTRLRIGHRLDCGNPMAVYVGKPAKLGKCFTSSFRALSAACFLIGGGVVLAAPNYVPPSEGKTIVDEVGNEFVSILGGSFQMGDTGEPDTPIQNISVRSYHIASTEVTFEDWSRVLQWAKANGYQFDHSGTGKADDHPVADVSWYDAVKWCNAKSEKEGLKPCYFSSAAHGGTLIYRKGRLDLQNPFVDWDASGYRLPTEAEWEKAARGGLAGLKYPHGNDIGKDVANFSMSNRSSGSKAVGAYEPNRFGLFDMAGNIQEWCWDRYASDGYKTNGKKDPKGGETGSNRVSRGGSWYGNAGKCRVARRDFSSPDTATGSLGFRLVRP